MFLWLALLLLANQLFQGFTSVPRSGFLDGFVALLGERSAFYYLAWVAVFRLLLDSASDTRASPLDCLVACLVAALNFLSANSVAWLSATATGLFLLVTSPGDRKLQAAATVLLALCLNGLWGPLLFDAFAPQFLQVDAALVGSVLTLTQPGMMWDQTILGTPGGHRIFVYTACSSFHNISLGLLCWVSVLKLARTTFVRSDALFALAVAGTVILLNASRLYLMALSEPHFVYWHDGFGQHLFAWAMTFSVLLISLWGALRRVRAQ